MATRTSLIASAPSSMFDGLCRAVFFHRVMMYALFASSVKIIRMGTITRSIIRLVSTALEYETLLVEDAILLLSSCL